MDLSDAEEHGWEARASWLPLTVVMELGKQKYNES